MEQSNDQKIKELEQENFILKEMEKEYERIRNEITQEKQVIQGIEKEIEDNNKKLETKIYSDKIRFSLKQKKFYATFTILGVIIVSMITAYVWYEDLEQKRMAIERYEHYESLKTQFLQQDTKGNLVKTWAIWNKDPNETIKISIIDQGSVTDKTDLVTRVIYSTETTESTSLLPRNDGPQKDTITNYIGWQGALAEAAEYKTHYTVPKDIITISDPNETDIQIYLTPLKNEEGYFAVTKSIVNDNEILKSTITIYDTDNITKQDLEVLLRQNIGMALGLTHSESINDLMSSTINEESPHISSCHIESLVSLYDGKKIGSDLCISLIQNDPCSDALSKIFDCG